MTKDAWKWIVRIIISIILLVFLTKGYLAAVFDYVPYDLSLVNKLLDIGPTSNEAFHSFMYWLPLCFAIIGAISLLIPKRNKGSIIFLIVLFVIIYMGPQILLNIGNTIASHTKTESEFQTIMLDKSKFSEPYQYFRNNNEIKNYKYVFVNLEDYNNNFDEAYNKLEKNAYDMRADGVVIVKDATREYRTKEPNSSHFAKHVYGVPFLKTIKTVNNIGRVGFGKTINIILILGCLFVIGFAHFLSSTSSGYFISSISILVIGGIATFVGSVITLFAFAYKRTPSYPSGTTPGQLLISLCFPLIGIGIIIFGLRLLSKSAKQKTDEK